MQKELYTIGISCIGSGVGQSVINSLLLSRLPIRTIGFGSNPFAYGAYDCDAYDYTKNIYEEGFIENLIEKCLEHGVDLVIPGLDDEVLLHSRYRTKFQDAGILTICAGEDLISLCRDKERMSRELNKVVDVFVQSYDLHTYNDGLESGRLRFPFIAKPRGGFASRGVEIIRSYDDVSKLTDNHVIQELAMPEENDPHYDYFMSEIARNRNPQVAEISIQLVYGNDGALLGRMCSYNKLHNGIPIEIIPFDDARVWAAMDKLTPVFLSMGLRGPLNLQGRLTKNGLKIFEMNPRFTGITGLRALMGFNEVEACIKDWLGLDKDQNRLEINYDRFGVRQTADKAISLDRNREVMSVSHKINRRPLKTKKTICITGACGYLGQALLKKLSIQQPFDLWVMDVDKSRAMELFHNTASQIYDRNDLEQGRLPLGGVDILVHLGFTRPHGTYQKIADSLNFTSKLFGSAFMHDIPAIINISSQSVYGLETPPPWTENTMVCPSTPYAQAKYASELCLEMLAGANRSVRFSSLRLATLAGGGGGLVEVDFLTKFVRQAINGEPINIFGGGQQMERLDVRDAADAIVAMINSNPLDWERIYNLGAGKTYNLLDIAERVVNRVSEYVSGNRSEIIVEEKEINMYFGMDSSSFYADMSWQPHFDIDDTIVSLINYFMENQNLQ